MDTLPVTHEAIDNSVQGASPNRDYSRERVRGGQMNSDDQSRTRLLIALVITALAGLFVMFISVVVESRTATVLQLAINTLHLVGTTLFIGVCMTLIHEFYLRKSHLEITSEAVRGVAESVAIDSDAKMRDSIRAMIDKAMPPKYINIREAGIVDAYTPLSSEHVSRKLENIQGVEVRVLKMWIEDFHALQGALIKAISLNDCSARIMLLHPGSKEAIAKRALSLPNLDPDHIAREIELNLEKLYATWRVLPDNAKAKFQVRLHQSFIAASLYGFADEFVFGLYLNGRLATQGTQIKVHGSEHSLYKELQSHFEEEWRRAEPYDFNEHQLRRGMDRKDKE